MYFDVLAGIVERHLPEFTPMLREARIFRLDRKETEAQSSNLARPGDTLATWKPDERTVENFRLPFPVISLECATHRMDRADRCVILQQDNPPETRRLRFLLASSEDEGDVAIAAGSIIALPNASDYLDDRSLAGIGKPEQMRMWHGSKRGLVPAECQVAWLLGAPDRSTIEQPHLSLAGSVMTQVFGPQVHLKRLHQTMAKGRARVAHLSCLEAILLVLTINAPASFIVEETPQGSRGSRLTIPRTSDRPHFIVLDPLAIKKRFFSQGDGDDEGPKRTVGAHERRGHYRRLMSEKFVRARGQVIWIEPIWVGPSEAVQGPNRYKVRLDL